MHSTEPNPFATAQRSSRANRVHVTRVTAAPCISARLTSGQSQRPRVLFDTAYESIHGLRLPRIIRTTKSPGGVSEKNAP